MSKFEPRAAEQKCGNCKWWEATDLTLVTFPMQGRCRKFEVPISGDCTTCLEDEFGKPEEIAEKVKEFAEKQEPSIPHDWAVKQIAKDQNEPSLTDRVAKIEKRIEANDTEFAKVFKGGFFEWQKNIEKRLCLVEKHTEDISVAFDGRLLDFSKRLEALEKVGISKTETTTEKKWRVGYKCPKCGTAIPKTFAVYRSDLFNYCPNCGAKVEEE